MDIYSKATVMKLGLILFLLQFLAQSVFLYKFNRKKVEICSRALIDIINNHLLEINNLKYLDFIIIDQNYRIITKEIISNVLKNCNNSLHYSTIYKEESENKSIILKHSSIIFIRSDEYLGHITERVYHKIIDLKLHHFIFIFECTGKMPKFSKSIFGVTNMLHYSSVLYQDPNSFNIKLLTTNSLASICKNQSIFVLENEYLVSENQWRNLRFGFKQVKDFENCTLIIHCSSMMTVYGFNDGFSNTMELIQDKFNFKAKIISSKSPQTDVDMAIHFSATAGYYDIYIFLSIELTLMYSAGEIYDSYEKLILPFDTETWILLGISFAIGVFIILFVKIRHINWKNIVFGSFVETPIFNMVIAFFGQSQNVLPGLNFARYLMIMFILFCLVIRTGYQGVQFDLILKVNRLFKKYTLNKYQ